MNNTVNVLLIYSAKKKTLKVLWLVFKPVGEKKTSKFIVCVFDCSLGKQINETTPIQWWLCIFFSLCVPEKKSWLLNNYLSTADKDYPNSSLCVLSVHQGAKIGQHA